MEPRLQVGDSVLCNGPGWDPIEFNTVKTIVRVYDDGGGMTEDQWYCWLEGHGGAAGGYTVIPA